MPLQVRHTVYFSISQVFDELISKKYLFCTDSRSWMRKLRFWSFQIGDRKIEMLFGQNNFRTLNVRGGTAWVLINLNAHSGF